MAEPGAEIPQVNEAVASRRNWKPIETKTGLKIRGAKNRQELREDKQILEKESRTDTLTGLPNERAIGEFLDGLENAWERSPEDHKLKGSFLALDLSRLKRVNDTYGRPAGDLYLTSVSEAIKEALRQEDRIFRLGTESDEFAVATPNLTSEENLEMLMDRIDRILKEKQAEAVKLYPGIEFSLSYAAVRYHIALGPKDAYLRSHVAMKEAKQLKEKETGERGSSVGRIII